MKTILLTFDVEEFDLPKEYNQEISEKEMFEISKQGLESLLNLLGKYKIPATFFTTANFAKKFPKLIEETSKQHEIACHGLEHSDSYINDISRIQEAKTEIEKIIKKQINGFRAPRFKISDISLLSGLSFSYDSSTHPIYLPGRYNNLFQKKNIHKIGDLIEIPMSTLLPNFSIFFLAFKNFPFSYAKTFTKINFLLRNYTMLTLHPWEFIDISKFKVPWHINRVYGQKLLTKFENYIKFCKKQGYVFESVRDFLTKSQ